MIYRLVGENSPSLVNDNLKTSLYASLAVFENRIALSVFVPFEMCSDNFLN